MTTAIPCAPRLFVRIVLLVAALGLCLPAPTPAQDGAATRDELLRDIRAAQAKAGQRFEGFVSNERDYRATQDPSGIWVLLGERNPDYQRYERGKVLWRQRVAQEESKYRQTVSAEILAATANLPLAEQRRVTGQLASEATRRYESKQRAAQAWLVQGLRDADGDEAKRRAAFNTVDGMLRSARADMEMKLEASRRLSPVAGGNDFVGRRAPTSATTVRLDELMRRAGETDTNVRRGTTDPAEHEAAMWILGERQKADIEEYRRLARNGLMVDPSSREPIEGALRSQMAEDAERALADHLRRRVSQPGFMDWYHDSRSDDAAAVQREVESAPEYQALDWLTPSRTTNMPEYFRAAALATRRSAQGVDEWRDGFIPDSKFSAGAGRAHYIAGSEWTGDQSLAAVDRRIDAYKGQVDRVVAAFDAAAATTPEGLSPEHRQLLTDMGFIDGSDPRRLRYQVPQGVGRIEGLKSNLNLPGAHWLDAISAKNATQAVVAAAVPQMAAARVASLLTAAGAGTRMVQASAFATDLLAGAAVDAGFEYAETGTVDAGRLALDSLVLGPAMAAGHGLAAGAFAERLKSNGTLRRQAEQFVAQSLGLTSESAVQEYITAAREGRGTSYEGLLSNMVSGLVARGAAGGLEVTGRSLEAARKLPLAERAVRAADDWAKPRMPEGLYDAVFRDPAERARMQERTAAWAETVGGARERLDQALGRGTEAGGTARRDAPDEATAGARVDDALVRGELSWADLKLLYAEDPSGLASIMRDVNQRRDRTFRGMEAQAKERASTALQRDHDGRRRDIEGRYAGDPAGRDRALAELDRWYRDEQKLIAEPLVAPGSKNLSSDIDRSARSTYVRRELKTMSDEVMAAAAGRDGLPPTTARAYDVNEYIDVFPTVSRTLDERTGARRSGGPDLADQPVGGPYGGLKLAQASEANSLAAAMLHLTPEQRRKYRQNRLEALPPGEGRTKMERLFDVADERLAVGERELRTEVERLVAENPALDAADPDTVLRARDNLYGRRTEALRDKEVELSGTTDPARKRQLTAEIELGWNEALREGIEAYSDFTSLDAIVKRGQLADRSVADLIADPAFTAKELGYDPRQAEGMLNDQAMMMSHHLNGYHAGHEGMLDAASALGKYAERSVLAHKLMGSDLATGPLKDLGDFAKELVANRKDPAALQRVLERYGKGSATRGLERLQSLIETTTPGMAGLFTPEGTPGAGGTVDPGGTSLREARARLALARERERDRARLAALDGPTAAAAAVRQDLSDLELEETSVRSEHDRLEGLRTKYRTADWPEAEKLQNELDALDLRLANIPDARYANDQTTALRQRRHEVEKRLAELASRRGAVPPPSDDELRLARRLSSIGDEKKALTTEAERFEAAGRLEEAEAAAEGAALLEPVPPPLSAAALGATTDTAYLDHALNLSGAAPTATTTGVAVDDHTFTGGLPEPETSASPVASPEAEPALAALAAEGGSPANWTSPGYAVTVAKGTYVVGAPLGVRYRTPDADDAPRAGLYVARLADGARVTDWSTAQRGGGASDIAAPADPDRFEVRLVVDDRPVAGSAFETIVTPEPDALVLTQDTYRVGEPVRVLVRVPEGRTMDRGWVGLFRPGLQVDGGARAASSRLAWQRLERRSDALSFDGLEQPGTYEVRLYDRDAGRYMLAARRFHVVAPPARGSLALDSRTYDAGTTVTVTVDLPPGTYTNRPYVAMHVPAYRVGRQGGSKGSRISYQHFDGTAATLRFRAPASPGTYEFRLYDRNADHHLLDQIPFTVRVLPRPGALRLPRTTYPAGATVIVGVSLPEDVYVDRPYVALFSPGLPAPGGGLGTRVRQSYQHFEGHQAVLRFTAPVWPGQYEFRLYDRNDDQFVLDQAGFSVEIPAAPGCLSVSPAVTRVGTTVAVSVDLPAGTYLDRPYVALYWQGTEQDDTTAGHDPERLAYQHFDGLTATLTFTAPPTPGTCELRLFDRNDDRYVLDRTAFRVVLPSAPGALATDAATYRIGRPVTVSITVPQGTYLDRPYVALVLPNRPVPGGARADESRQQYQHFAPEDGRARLVFTAPSWPGRYELQLFDRNDSRYVLDRTSFDVEVTRTSGALTAPPTVRAGTPVTVTVALPEGTFTDRPWVGLYRPTRTVRGGAVVPAERIAYQHFEGSSASLTFTAPDAPGWVELRLHDRGDALYLLETRLVRIEKEGVPFPLDEPLDAFTAPE